MRRHPWIWAAPLLLLFTAIPGTLQASPITFTQQFAAEFQLSFLAGTPLNPGATDTPFLDFRALGSLTFNLDPLLNDPSAPDSVAITGVTGNFHGVAPSPILPFTLSPDLEFLGGDLINIVRDAGGDVVSGQISNLQMRWIMTGPGGLTLFTLDGLRFDGAISSLPLAPGTVLSGLEPFNGYLLDSNTNPLVAIGRNRTLTAFVPEPSTLALAAAGAGTLGLLPLRRRRARAGARAR